MKKIVLLFLLCLNASVFVGVAQTKSPRQPRTSQTVQAGRWTIEKANAWYAKQPFLVGANFIPSTAVNELEMWQADTFDPQTIDRELALAESLGMNIMRVFLHNIPYDTDKEGFLKRINEFLTIADKHHIKIMFVLFDSCWNDNPKAGKQPEPKTGVHNSGWLRCPGTQMLFDSRTWGKLEDYTKGIIGAFANDSRVLVWDLFNEPSNSGYLDAVVPLLKKSFEWARAVNPSQPLTAGWWHDHPMSNEIMLNSSDIITFHNYVTPEKLEAQIKDLQATYKRPLICTEYMARKHKSTFEGCLPIFDKYKVGAINWGLVKGKTNTIYAWDEPLPGGEEPKLWFHDIFRPDGTPYQQQEVETIRKFTKAGK
ncbi:glycoside hydrolase family 2 TIM barrel-domain containing protein [Cytophagaceae bacterium YF14B1]|uniref:Glycoside hydrolase family 2 TIM barrel-domain containing protein n=1 Tax=Xanthocytophaga flava TaxID=3048013 RepID=A0AAE3QKE2_9BACT|nr:glycoside hydrolase family 2 TIM barrel-domain containing protein [Xanthocytophaga flavus]MDJ1479038.1 glycoside hydrolase family 2 TIM barrel-domain containing protein [Xanthocytophaga flavus]